MKCFYNAYFSSKNRNLTIETKSTAFEEQRLICWSKIIAVLSKSEILQQRIKLNGADDLTLELPSLMFFFSRQSFFFLFFVC